MDSYATAMMTATDMVAAMRAGKATATG
eukprot:SAG11_NODE_36854_length_259_cov_1.293750_1_plen_27_part_10